MIKISGMILVTVCLILGGISVSLADEQEAAAVTEELSTELQSEGALSQQDIKAIKKPMKNMIKEGATKEEMKGVISDLSKKGVKGKQLKTTVESMNELVKKGESPKEAGNIVSQAAHQAQAEGLKGKDLAARVHEAIKQRKTEREQLRLKEKEMKRERERTKEKTMEMEGAGGKMRKGSGVESGAKGSKGRR